MAEETGISWCDATFNPWVGCAKVSPGCAHCYAETMVTGRMGRPGTWGEDGVRERTSVANWRKPLRWNELALEGRLPNGAENRDGHRPRVFCASLADVFEPRPELDPWREDLFDLIGQTTALDWLVLTKRPDVMRDWLAPLGAQAHVWVGTSIENARHTSRAEILRQIPAAVRFISAEPLLGSLFEVGDSQADRVATYERWGFEAGIHRDLTVNVGRAPLNLDGIDWVIVGGESGGRSARPMQAEWAREIRDAVLYGSSPPRVLGQAVTRITAEYLARGRERERPALHFKQWGSHDANGVYRGAGPKSAGKLLDGVEWCEFPPSPALVAA